jgi:hypothetical protein
MAKRRHAATHESSFAHSRKDTAMAIVFISVDLAKNVFSAHTAERARPRHLATG